LAPAATTVELRCALVSVSLDGKDFAFFFFFRVQHVPKTAWSDVLFLVHPLTPKNCKKSLYAREACASAWLLEFLARDQRSDRQRLGQVAAPQPSENRAPDECVACSSRVHNLFGGNLSCWQGYALVRSAVNRHLLLLASKASRRERELTGIGIVAFAASGPGFPRIAA
jgi:hypothetical protein